MSLRKTALDELCIKYPYYKIAASLHEFEFNGMMNWLEEHDNLGHLEFEYAVNRMTIKGVKQKQLMKIMDLLISANSRVHTRNKNERI